MAWFKKNNDDVNFMSEISAATMASTHWGGHILLLLIAAFIGIALWWASVAEIDEVTRGQGKVVPSSKVQIIQNLEGGILADVLVSEGQMVEKGDVLLKIDDTRFSSSFRESKLTYWELVARTARLSAESEGKPLELPDELMINQPELAAEERGLYQSRQLQLQSTIDVLKRQVEQRRQELVEKQAKQQQLSRSFELSNQELQMSEPLLAAGVMSEVEILRLKRTVNDLKGEMESNRLAIPRIRSSIDEVQQKINEAVTRFESEAARELSEVRAEMARTEESVSALKDRVTRTNVRSPMKGTIKRLMINTIGGVIQPGMDLVEIVPLEDN
ncbi:HlyD family type I secretion periplasmic adaptor subunit, partial [Methylophaga sp. UBA4204]